MPRKKIEDKLSKKELMLFEWMKQKGLCKNYSKEAFKIFNELLYMYIKNRNIANNDKSIGYNVYNKSRIGRKLINFCVIKVHRGRNLSNLQDRIIGFTYQFKEIAYKLLLADYQQPQTSYFFELIQTALNNKLFNIDRNSNKCILYLPKKNIENYNVGTDARLHTSAATSTYDWIGIRKEIRELIFNGCYEVDMTFAYGQIAQRDFNIDMTPFFQNNWKQMFNGAQYHIKDHIGSRTRQYTMVDTYSAKVLRSALFNKIEAKKWKNTTYLAQKNREIVNAKPSENYYGQRETEIIQQVSNDETLLIIRDAFITTTIDNIDTDGWQFNFKQYSPKFNDEDTLQENQCNDIDNEKQYTEMELLELSFMELGY